MADPCDRFGWHNAASAAEYSPHVGAVYRELTASVDKSPDPAAGRRLRAYVLRRTTETPGWTLDLAARVGVSKTALMAWFAGREPSLDSCGRLAGVLGVRRWEVVRVLDGDAE